MYFSPRSVLVAVLVAASTTSACSSSTQTLPANTDPDAGAIAVFPTAVFVAIDDTGKALGSVPVGVTGATGTATWTSSAAIVTATGTNKNGQITAVKAGTATVTVKAGTRTATVSVTVNTYPAGDVAKGMAEYVAAKCDGCHNASGPDATPSDIGKHSDDEILASITQGTNPEGGRIMVPHKFTATNAILAYMRSVPARTDTPVQDK